MGTGCPECGKKKARETIKWKITQKEFLSKIPHTLRKKIIIKDKYKGQLSKIKVKCVICNRSWITIPWRLYRNYGCECCARKKNGEKIRKPVSLFKREVREAHDGTIKILEKYSTGENRIKVQCKQCGHKWSPVAQRLLRRGCPRCCDSKGEKKIDLILRKNKVKYERQFLFKDLKGKLGGLLRFDFAVFKGNKLSHLIEYDGRQHFEAFDWMGGKKRLKKTQENDQLKNKYCKRKGIKLIRISYKKFATITLKGLLNAN
jgi:hypothetical protein